MSSAQEAYLPIEIDEVDKQEIDCCDDSLINELKISLTNQLPGLKGKNDAPKK